MEPLQAKPRPPFDSGSHHDAVSQTLERMADHYKSSSLISIGELIHALRNRGFALLMLVLVLPNCVPIPIPPGGSTLFSIPLLFIAVQMLWGKKHPWLPKWLEKKTLEQQTIDKVIRSASPRLRWIEKFLHPRLTFTNTKTGEQIVGFIWMLFALSIAVPLPMTNFIPGIGTLVMALGMLGRDGLVVIIGALIGMIGIALTALILFFGTAAIAAIFPFLA